jgi:NarL family two-component system response regulator LiaR
LVSNDNIRVILADDHALFREGLKELIDNERDLDCIGVADNGEDAITLTKQLHPDVIVMDVAMPVINGIQALKQIKLFCPSAAVIIVSAFHYQKYVKESIAAGVDGYLLKNIHRSELINSIRIVHAGQRVFSPEIASELAEKVNIRIDREQPLSEPSNLSSLEIRILELAAKGMSNKQIASDLSISNQAVASHFNIIFRKLNVESRTQAVIHALKKGMFTLDDL